MTNRLNIKNKSIEYSSVDLMNEPQTRDFASSLPVNFPIYWFHCVGLSSGNYFLPGSGNRWLPFEQLTRKHFESEVIPFWVSTTNVAKSLWPKFKEQNGTKIVLVSSMSATRSYIFGASHCPAEAAMDRLASVLSLEAYKNKIWITTLRAGAIDTGTYDENDVQDSIKKIVREYGANWDDGLKLAPPSSVGEAAACAFASSAHLSVISLISQGQFPHESS
jgi:NAD(P)-dependent dehydrogenase (short-subunit alcohol dehydrogenase family)